PDLGQIAGDAELQQGPDREATVEEPLDVQVHGERGSVVGVAQEPERRTARPRAGVGSAASAYPLPLEAVSATVNPATSIHREAVMLTRRTPGSTSPASDSLALSQASAVSNRVGSGARLETSNDRWCSASRGS